MKFLRKLIEYLLEDKCCIEIKQNSLTAAAWTTYLELVWHIWILLMHFVWLEAETVVQFLPVYTKSVYSFYHVIVCTGLILSVLGCFIEHSVHLHSAAESSSRHLPVNECYPFYLVVGARDLCQVSRWRSYFGLYVLWSIAAGKKKIVGQETFQKSTMILEDC